MVETEIKMEPKARRTRKHGLRSTRRRYLKVFVFAGLTTFQILGLEKNPENIIGFLKVCQFVTQILLKTALYCLRIPDRGREISLKDFRGQLELDPTTPTTKMPYWKVYLETNALITKKCFARALLRYLFPGDWGIERKDGTVEDKFREQKFRNSVLKIWYAPNLDKLVEEDRFSTKFSHFLPV